MSVVPAYNPPMPVMARIQTGLQHGSMIRIKGQMNHNGTRFHVNLMCGVSLSPLEDIALHISVRLDENAIVRNHYERNVWGTEERFGGCPIQRGAFYEILILSESSSYKIAINGKHFCEFPHRLSLSRVSYINITGETTVSSITTENDLNQSSGPQIGFQNPTAPPFSAVAATPSIPQPMHQIPIMPSVGSAPPVYSTPNMPMMQPIQAPVYNQQSAALSYGAAPYPQQQQPYAGNMYTMTSSTPSYGQTPYPMNQQYIPAKKEDNTGLAVCAVAAAAGIGIGAYAIAKAVGSSSSSSSTSIFSSSSSSTDSD